ncbi:MAG: uroporphyrinogen decarboxylase family protein [Terrimicrobiaceae bacterium]
MSPHRVAAGLLRTTRRDDMVAVLQRRIPPKVVPTWELEFHAWDAALGRHVVLGREFESLSAAQQERAIFSNAEILLSVAAEMGWAALTVPGGYWEEAPGKLAYYCLPGEAREWQTRVLRELAPPDLMLVASATGVLGADYSEEFCARMFEEPESIDRQAEETLRTSLEIARRFRDLGVEAVFTASDIADNSGPFFKPSQMKRWIHPFLRRWAEGVHALGLFGILHSDGDLTSCLGQLAGSGVDAIQAIDPVAGMDMREAKQQVGGRVCLCGNMDCGLLLSGTPDQVFEATQRLLLACKPGGAFVLGASNAVQPEVPMANYRAMIAAWRQFGI